MKEIKRVDIMSYAKLHGVIFAIFGFIAGLFIGALGSLFSTMSDSGGGANFLGSLGLLSVIIFPIIYGTLGFIAGLITAAIYNLIAGWVGGLKVELRDVN